jgi:hypothetical protein
MSCHGQQYRDQCGTFSMDIWWTKPGRLHRHTPNKTKIALTTLVVSFGTSVRQIGTLHSRAVDSTLILSQDILELETSVRSHDDT